MRGNTASKNRYACLRSFPRVLLRVLVLAFPSLVGVTSLAAPNAGKVEFKLDQMRLDGALFKIANHSSRTIQIPNIFSEYSGYAFSPAYPIAEGMRKGKWVRLGNLGSDDVLPNAYSLRPGESEFFSLPLDSFLQFEGCKYGRIRLPYDHLLSEPFRVPRIRPGEVRLLMYESEEHDLIFKIQNLGEMRAELPSLRNEIEGADRYEIANFTWQTLAHHGWSSEHEVSLGETDPKRYFLGPKEAVLFRISRECFAGAVRGQLERIKVGAFTSQPFRLP